VVWRPQPKTGGLIVLPFRIVFPEKGERRQSGGCWDHRLKRKQGMTLVSEFVKRNGAWHFYHPDYARRSGGKEPYTVVFKEGLHTFLDAVAKDATTVVVHTSDESFEGCDELELTRPEPDGLGGYYLLKTLHQKPYVLLIRFFDVQSFFGYLPSNLYLKAEVSSALPVDTQSGARRGKNKRKES
jgi:hypothetical protein